MDKIRDADVDQANDNANGEGDLADIVPADTQNLEQRAVALN